MLSPESGVKGMGSGINEGAVEAPALITAGGGRGRLCHMAAEAMKAWDGGGAGGGGRVRGGPGWWVRGLSPGF